MNLRFLCDDPETTDRQLMSYLIKIASETLPCGRG